MPLMGLFFAQLIPRSIGLAVFAQSLSILQQYAPSLQIKDVAGMARRFPIVSAGSGAEHVLFGRHAFACQLSGLLFHLVSARPELSFVSFPGFARQRLIFIAGLRALVDVDPHSFRNTLARIGKWVARHVDWYRLIRIAANRVDTAIPHPLPDQYGDLIIQPISINSTIPHAIIMLDKPKNESRRWVAYDAGSVNYQEISTWNWNRSTNK